MDEKRTTTRVKWENPINFKIIQGKSLFGDVKNISYSGVYVVGSDMTIVADDDICTFQICLSNTQDNFLIEGKARVARKIRKRAVALDFFALELASQIHLRQVLASNWNNAQFAEENSL